MRHDFDHQREVFHAWLHSRNTIPIPANLKVSSSYNTRSQATCMKPRDTTTDLQQHLLPKLASNIRQIKPKTPFRLARRAHFNIEQCFFPSTVRAPCTVQYYFALYYINALRLHAVNSQQHRMFRALSFLVSLRTGYSARFGRRIFFSVLTRSLFAVYFSYFIGSLIQSWENWNPSSLPFCAGLGSGQWGTRAGQQMKVGMVAVQKFPQFGDFRIISQYKYYGMPYRAQGKRTRAGGSISQFCDLLLLLLYLVRQRLDLSLKISHLISIILSFLKTQPKKKKRQRHV